MLRIILASVIIAGALGCGIPPIEPNPTRVVGGVEAIPHSWPWQISLQYLDNEEWRHTCGGSLIATNWVLTAAQCISEDLTYRVYVGKFNLLENEAGSGIFTPEKIIVHETWNPSFVNLGYDVALIKLTEQVSLSDTVQLGCLPPAGDILPNTYPCYLTGWGRTSSIGLMSAKLHQALLSVVDRATCTQPDWWGDTMSSNVMCAGGDGIVAACGGDAGGPLNCKNAEGVWEVHGLVSYNSGLSCNTFKKPTVFTRVSFYNDWIDQVLTNN